MNIYSNERENKEGMQYSSENVYIKTMENC